MKCLKCQFNNREEANFCKKCGINLEPLCPSCLNPYEPDSTFCDECGQRLDEAVKTKETVQTIDGERKYVTVLFSDLLGYTAMSERLDPEELKEITSRIFEEIAQIITKYEGFVEKFIGDAVMAIFGAKRAFEDDPIRAILAAREIHKLVEALSPEFEKRIEQPLSMHTGINTGLVVTGEVILEKGTHGISGNTINLAARLSSIGRAGDILVGPDTYSQSEGYFSFKDLGPTKVKGRDESVQVYKVLTLKKQIRKVRRIHGLRAKLVGRDAEIDQVKEAVVDLRNGKGSIFSICGAAGTGKSRLIEEFKATLDLDEIQWREGHAYPFAQNIPYYPLIDLMSRAMQIEEGDSQEKVRSKVESRIEALMGKGSDVIPYIGSLFALSYPEIEGISPDSWKFHLQNAIQKIISALTKRAPTIICLEDLHWADPSSIELIRLISTEIRHPALFLCVYRPIITLFTSHQLVINNKLFKETTLHDLSSSEMLEMLESLLRTDNAPPNLRKFILDNIQGNPFYLEEVVNSLIESETLIREDENWVLSKPISKSEISPTIQGVISARLDRLGRETKRTLQEASVIGRTFSYEIIKRISEVKDHIDEHLKRLEQHDLIRTKSLRPDLEYVFKHALTQEVVYNSLLKKERKLIHERIARVIEKLFEKKLSIFETLAFHYEQAECIDKAVYFLVKSGEKSINKYAVEESHNYYLRAYNLLSVKTQKGSTENISLIDLINRWAFVYHYRGDFYGLKKLLIRHEDLAKGLGDLEKLGMYYALLGFVFFQTGDLRHAYEYLCRSLAMGEKISAFHIIGYACSWLSWCSAELGFLDEAIGHGKRAIEIYQRYQMDDHIYWNALGGIGLTHWFKGDRKNTFETGKKLLDWGQKYDNIRGVVLGHFVAGCSYFMEGELKLAAESFQHAISVSVDPWFSQFPGIMLCVTLITDRRFQEAEKAIGPVLSFCEKFGTELIRTLANSIWGIVLISKGHLTKGFKILEDAQKIHLEKGRRSVFAIEEHVLGRLFCEISKGSAIRPSIIQNIGFLIKKVPFAKDIAEGHFKKAIEVGGQIGAEGIQGQACLDLGLMYMEKGNTEQARKFLSSAIPLLDRCDIRLYTNQAKKAMKALK